jgi:hypothetical protein
MRKQDKYIIGIGFWIGGEVFSIINIIKILTTVNPLHYDFIMTGVAVIFIILCLILLRKKKIQDTGNTKVNFKFGMFFWIGGGVYSLINMIMNLKNVPQSSILSYNYILSGAAVIGLILNLFLLKKERTK